MHASVGRRYSMVRATSEALDVEFVRIERPGSAE
jgi:hypothetical protein